MPVTLPSTPSFGQGLQGAAPGFWSDTAAVDGDRPPWSRAPQGSSYWQRVTANQIEERIKVKSDGRDDDWVIRGFISQRVTAAEMTDGGSTTGTKVLNCTIPAGAFVTLTLLTTLTDFVGSAAVTWTLGDGTDVDRYSTGTPSLATTAVMAAEATTVSSGLNEHTAAISTVTFTVTDDSDFGDLVAGGGAVTINIFYVGNAAA